MIGAHAGIGVAVANFSPTIGLSTLYGGASNKIGNVVKDSASLWNIAANLSGPIFQGGRLLESYYAQKAFWDETIASYRGTIVQALREVAAYRGGRTDDLEFASPRTPTVRNWHRYESDSDSEKVSCRHGTCWLG